MFGRVWHTAIEGTFYEIRLALTGFPRSVVVYVNGRPALRERRAERRGPYEFKVGTHAARILVADGGAPGELSYYLTIDGRPVETAIPIANGVNAAGGDRARVLAVRNNGARWFYWIGGFSVVNSLLAATGSSLGFLIGLALTYFVDGFFMAFTHTARPPVGALVVDLLIAGVFVLFGRLALRGATWPFVVGGLLYVFDLGLFLLVQDFASAAFHGYALIWIYKGWRAARSLRMTPVAPPVVA